MNAKNIQTSFQQGKAYTRRTYEKVLKDKFSMEDCEYFIRVTPKNGKEKRTEYVRLKKKSYWANVDVTVKAFNEEDAKNRIKEALHFMKNEIHCCINEQG